MRSSESKKRILVLDKNTRLSKVVNEITPDSNFDIYTFYDSHGLFEQAKTVRPDLILLDCILPDRDCEMICQDLKEDDLLKNIPIVVITTSNSKKQMSNSFKCDALFVKPNDMSATASQIFFRDIKNYFAYLIMKMGNPYAYASA